MDHPAATSAHEAPKDKTDHEQDLTTVLDKEERMALTLLITNITETMQRQVSNIFDAAVSQGRAGTGDRVGNKLSHAQPGKPDATNQEDKETKKLREKREKELSVPEMSELRTATLKYFQTWRDLVIKRLGEVVNDAKEHIGEQKKEASTDPTLEKKVNVETRAIDLDTDVQEADAALIQLYPPTSTALCNLDKEKRVLILHAMLLLLLSLENYSAHSRVLLIRVASSLHLPIHILLDEEVKIAQGLLEAAKQMSGSEEATKRSHDNKISRIVKVSLAGAAGAAVIGITGGLAAPLVAAGIGTVMGGLGLGATTAATLLGTLAESGVIVGSLFGAYGGRMTGKMMDEYAKEVEDFAFLPLKASSFKAEPQTKDHRLRVTIGISGWLTQKEDIVTPWRALGRQSEVFALRWELEALSKLGASLESLVKSAAWSVAKKEIIARTIFGSLMEAMWPLALLKVSKVVDNPFSVGMSRADKAGLVLADAIINKAQGERPVTLVGYSLGARVIYSCLMSLAERRAFGMIDSVALIGSPAPSDATVWRILRSVVSGRLINVYSENDYVLAFLYRTSRIQFGVAGLQEIQEVPAIENVDVSEMVSGHLRYQYLIGGILQKIGFEDIDSTVVAQELETVALLEEEEEKEAKEESKEDKASGQVNPDTEAVEMEKEVEKKTEHHLMHRAAERLHLGGETETSK